MKQILVGTDLSARSDRAVDRGFLLAETLGARLTLLHVIDSDLPEEIADSMREKALSRLTTRIAQDPSVDAHADVAVDDPLAAIHKGAEARGADLVILGVHRARPLADIFTSTTMERLVRGSRRPVLLVKDPVEGPYRQPLCGIDLSPACAAAARAAAQLAPNVDIHSFYAFHAPFRGLGGGAAAEMESPFFREAIAELEAWLADADLPPRFTAPTPRAATVRLALDLAMKESAADVLVVGAHGRSSFSPNLLGAFTTELLRQPLCDTLVVRG